MKNNDSTVFESKKIIYHNVEERYISKDLEIIKKSADEASQFAESIINTVREPLIVLDQDLRVVTVSRSFYEFFKVKPEETLGQL
ncbi:MAG: PAS domain-containing protein, partial [Campylobacteraceae bacterium]|nr:PAS domain-containing protein [Campylobacteraceae bacterium]